MTAAFFVPLGVFGAPALAKSAASASQEYAGASQYQHKVLLCHKTGSKTKPFVKVKVNQNAVKAHLKRGDVEPNADGTCPKPEAPTTTDSD